ncbi:hypothetical protein [Kribbella sp. CA-294648]|uniref:hypothetical protein n=1 Tax=Kribbella sp. CA-294648 TaxID=3239948 RepID=UPI003D8FCF45
MNDRTGVRLTNAGGWIAVAFGVVHVVVAPLDTRDIWSQVIAEGWWNTFTLDKAVSLAQLQRSESPAWALVVCGALVILGDRRVGRRTPAVSSTGRAALRGRG